MLNKVAIVTGGTSGLGKGISDMFVQEGFKTIAFDLHENNLLEQNKDAPGEYVFKKCDISNEEDVKKSINEVYSKYNNISVVVNNAGIIARRNSEEIKISKWDKVFAVNTRGTFLMCKFVAPILKKEKEGRIINISSVAAKLGDITSAPGYGPSKAAVEGITKTFARELAPYGVTVNSIAPHAIITKMSEDWSNKKREKVISEIPLGRMGRPEEVAEAVKFLISENAGFITGETIDINGGFLMD